MAALTLLKENIEGEKSAFIATFCTFLLWQLALLLASGLGGSFFKPRSSTAASSGHSANTSVTTVQPVKNKFDLERAARLIFLGLFSSVLVNHTLYGVSRAVAVLAWISFAVAASYLLVRTLLHKRGVGSAGILHRLIDVAALGVLAVLFTWIWSIAFHHRW